MSQLLTSSGQSTGASASILPMNIQGWFPLRLTGLISLLSKRLSRAFSSTTVWKHQIFKALPSFWSNSHIHTWLLGKKTQLWLYKPLPAKWYLCFLIPCLICHSFSSKEQESFDFIAAVTVCSDFGAQENKVCHCFHFFPIYLPWFDGTRCHDLSTKVHLFKAMVFPVVMYGCKSWTEKKAEHWRIDAFELWCWRRLLRVP